MHDASQDRLVIAGMTYFRVKWRRVPVVYRRFLEAFLPPRATLVVSDCSLRWPATSVGERHVFQHGAAGGAAQEQYEYGGPRIADYLTRYGSPHRAWDYPPMDGHSPEAEWVRARPPTRVGGAGRTQPLAARPHALRRAGTPQSGGCRPLPDVDIGADRCGDRLLVECFLLLEPWWALRTGSVPYWTVFNTEPSRDAVLGYLGRADPFDESRLLLFSHGVESVGLASAHRWLEVLKHALKIGVFTGVDTRAYPRDFASLARSHRELAKIRTTYPMPLPMEWPIAEEFLAKRRAGVACPLTGARAPGTPDHEAGGRGIGWSGGMSGLVVVGVQPG